MGAACRVTLALLIWEFLHALSSEKSAPRFPVSAKPVRALIEMDSVILSVMLAVFLWSTFSRDLSFFSGLEQNPSSSEHWTTAFLPPIPHPTWC